MFDVIADKSTPSGLAFTGNPIIVEADIKYEGQPVTGYPFTVSLDGRVIYTGCYSYPFTIDVAPIVDAFVSPFGNPEDAEVIDGYDPFLLLYDMDSLRAREVLVSFDGEFPDELGFIAIPGGISGQNFARLNSPKTDAFTERFLRRDCNFFLTSRTAGWRIALRETELAPLYMICDRDSEEIKVSALGIEVEPVTVYLDRGVYCLDLDRLRRVFFNRSGVLVNAFNIERAGLFSCQIVIVASPPAVERYRLRYRNSYGVFEVLEASGTLSVALTKESEYEDFKIFNRSSGRYSKRRHRPDFGRTYTLPTGIKHPSEFAALANLLASDEVYLLDAGPLPLRVIPSCEEFTFELMGRGPKVFTLELELVDTETHLLSDISSGDDSHRPKVFTKEFTIQFN